LECTYSAETVKTVQHVIGALQIHWTMMIDFVFVDFVMTPVTLAMSKILIFDD